MLCNTFFCFGVVVRCLRRNGCVRSSCLLAARCCCSPPLVSMRLLATIGVLCSTFCCSPPLDGVRLLAAFGVHCNTWAML